MTTIDVLTQWLNAYGGLVPLCIAMVVFTGGYAVLASRLGKLTLGQRRALAICCLAGGLLVGHLVSGHQPPSIDQTEETQPVDTVETENGHSGSPNGSPLSLIPLIIAGVGLAVFLYHAARKKLSINNLRALMIASAGIGLVFAVSCPRITFAAAIVFCLLLWFVYRVFIIKASPIPAQFRRMPGAQSSGSET